MKSFYALLCACGLAVSLAGCGGGAASGSASGPVSGGESAGPSASSVSSSSAPASSTSLSAEQEEGNRTPCTLYVGMDGQFEEYFVEYTGDLTETGQVPAEEVLNAMSSLTGWNLDLADQIYTGKGGITVSFADTSALFVGPPENQLDEFHMYDAYQLDQTILDSVKKTLQCWAVDPELGDPDSVDIWFCGPDGGDLVLPNSGVTIPCAEPYNQFPASCQIPVSPFPAS